MPTKQSSNTLRSRADAEQRTSRSGTLPEASDGAKRWTAPVVSTTRKLDNGDDSRLGRRGYCGGVRPPLPPRHDITAPEEPFHESGSIYLSSFFIVNFSTSMC